MKDIEIERRIRVESEMEDVGKEMRGILIEV